MSRIQQVLQKAEQDGTARRTRGVGDVASTGGRRPPVLVDSSLPVTTEVIAHAAALPPRLDAPRVEAEARPHALLVAATAPHSPAAERYRSLRTRIAQVEDGTMRRVLLMTSPGRGEGKSVTTLNLGLTMAQEFHRRVVVVDADFRRPRLHALLGLPVGPGLADVLLGGVALEDALVTIPDYRLAVLAAGVPTEQPTELLGSTAMRRLLEQLRGQFDRVLVDCAPVSPLADAGVLARLVDGVVLIVRAGLTQRPAIEQTLSEVEANKVLGLVLNDAGGPELSAYGPNADALVTTREKRRGARAIARAAAAPR